MKLMKNMIIVGGLFLSCNNNCMENKKSLRIALLKKKAAEQELKQQTAQFARQSQDTNPLDDENHKPRQRRPAGGIHIGHKK